MRLLLVALLVLCYSSADAQKSICITVDDLPTTSQVYRTDAGRQKLTNLLLGHLGRHHVPAIGFVIGQSVLTPQGLDSNQVNLLRQWLDAGLELGNHTFTHPDYNETTTAAYTNDVIRGEAVLKPILQAQGQPLRFFRHPYLRRGNTTGKRDSLASFLTSRGYQEAPVTVDNSDYIFSAAYDKALLRGDSVLAVDIGGQYVLYMLDCIHYYEAQADSLFGRSIPHSLLAHANTINAVYLGDLLMQLETEGYQFVALSDVLQDPAYSSADTYAGKGGISWLHRWALTKGKRGTFFRGEPEVPASVTALAER